MNPIQPYRDDGPLTGSLPADRLPVPEVVLLTVALVLVLVPLVLGPLGFGQTVPGPSAGDGATPLADGWVWVLGAWLFAALGSSGRVLPRLRWPVPALLRGVEYGAVLALVGDSPWSYALLAALAFHHYDIVYRVRLLGAGPPRWLGALGGGWSVRIAVLVAAAATDVVLPAVQILLLVLVPVFVLDSVAGWASAHRPATGR